MYEALLQSADRPFRATPDTKFYFPSDSIEQARQTVVRAVLRAEGPCLVLGGAGLGKTMLGQVIAEDVFGRFDIVKLHASGLCSRRALLQSILFELQLPYRGMSEGELRMSIMDRLSPSPETAPSGILLLVDEAHTLSPKLLEELRLITNFARNGQPRARLVLIGNMRLEDTFAHPQMDSFNQRLAARCYLQPMSRDQTMDFVRHQLRAVQIEPATLVTSDALRTLYSASEGVPRLVNQVMDHALVLGITSGQCPISAALIEEAWSDLQQLPAPWHSSNASATPDAASSSQIEFGELRSEDDEESFGESTLTTADSSSSDTGSTLVNSLSEKGSDPLRRDQKLDANDAPPKGQTPFRTGSIVTNAKDIAPEETYELAAEDEPLDVITRSPKQNFFAAFAPISAHSLDVDDEDDKSVISPEDQLVSEITADSSARKTERVVFDASQAFGFNRHEATFPRGIEPLAPTRLFVDTSVNESSELSKKNLTASNFFGSYPPDLDILDIDDSAEDTAEDTAAEYDAHSVWENDPPIREVRREPFQAERKAASVNPNSLFGEDFDEEISIAGKGSAGKDRRIFEPRPVEVAAAMPLVARQAAVEEQLAAMESQQAEFDDNRPYEDAEQAKRYAASQSEKSMAESLAANWTVDVAATEMDREIALHTEIEDLVSQLNFSAFAIEPFSVEQIAIDYQRGATPSKQPQALQSSHDARETIYTLHTSETTEMDDDIHSNLSLDDDRDLLIIEEELPVSNRMTTEQLNAPVVKAATYSQLFAKLRH